MITDFRFHEGSPVYFGHETVKKNAERIASYGKKMLRLHHQISQRA